MGNLDRLLRKIEKNFENKDTRETVDFTVGGENYKVDLLTRSEKLDFVFSMSKDQKTTGDMFNLLKPFIYKAFRLQEIAEKAKENGYIKTYYEIFELLFSPSEILDIMRFFMKANRFSSTYEEEDFDFEKKQ